MAHNLGRAVGRLAGHDLEKATAGTLQRRVFTVPGRPVHSGRRRHRRLPASWPWAAAIEQALTRIQAIPLRCRPPSPPTTRTSEKPADRRLPACSHNGQGTPAARSHRPTRHQNLEPWIRAKL
jgi:hypothetical protein